MFIPNNNNNKNKTVMEQKESLKLFTHPLRHVEKQITPEKNGFLEPMQPINRLTGTGDRRDRIRLRKEATKTIQPQMLKLQPKK